MVKTTEHRRFHNAAIGWQLVSMLAGRNGLRNSSGREIDKCETIGLRSVCASRVRNYRAAPHYDHRCHREPNSRVPPRPLPYFPKCFFKYSSYSFFSSGVFGVE